MGIITTLLAISLVLFSLAAAYIRVNEQVLFENANAKCQAAYGTNLASIHSNDDFDSVISICGTVGPCWLGGSTCSKNPSDNWQWMDGSLWDYEKWGAFSGVAQGEGLTGEYNTCIWGIWDQSAGNTEGVNDCGTNEAFYPICNSPYFVGQRSNWDMANAYCESQGAKLATIHSLEQFNAAKSICKSDGGWNCWIGMSLNTDAGVYEWTDYSTSDYGFENNDGSKPTTGVFPWGDLTNPQPDNYNNDESCIQLWYYQNYRFNDAQCSQLSYALCQHTAETIDIVLTTVSKTIYGAESLECPSDYSALSCGIAVGVGVVVSGQFEKYWSSYPVTDGDVVKCSGYDYFGGELYAVCGQGIGDLVISSQYVTSGDVYCPENYVVSGCGVRANNPGGGDWEVFKQVYPNNAGTSCHCYNYFGTTCYATCIQENKVDTTIKSQEFDAGFQRVTCDGSSVALGCGIRLHHHDGYEVYPKYYVDPAAPNSCVGYSYYPFSLYAICGEFK